MSSDEPIPVYGIGAEFGDNDDLLKCRDEIKADDAVSGISLFHLANLAREGGSKDDPDTRHYLFALCRSTDTCNTIIGYFQNYGAKPWVPPKDIIERATKRNEKLIREAIERGEDHIDDVTDHGEGGVLQGDGSITEYRPDLAEQSKQSHEELDESGNIEAVRIEMAAEIREVEKGTEDADRGMHGIAGDAMKTVLMRAKHEGYDLKKLAALVIVVEDESMDETNAGMACETNDRLGGLKLALTAAEVFAKDSGQPMHIELRKD